MDKRFIYQSKKRSCPKFQFKKLLHVKHGQIIATISQVSMFRMFLYIIGISIKHLKKFSAALPGCVCLSILVGKIIQAAFRQLATCPGCVMRKLLSKNKEPRAKDYEKIITIQEKIFPKKIRISPNYTTKVKINHDKSN